MAKLETKKLKVIERLVDSNDERIFDMINELLDKEITSSYIVPDEHYDLLKEDHDKYLKGELDTYTWDEVKQNARKAFNEIQNKKA